MAKKKPAAAEPPKALARRKPTAKPAAKAKASAGDIYQLKIVLDDIKPPIWRRVQTKDCSLAKVHDLIQRSLGWFDAHLHAFEIGSAEYGDPEQWPDDGMFDDKKQNERNTKLSALVGKGIKKIRYEYDMGDSWHHTITIEKLVPAEAGVKYPRCIAGARACPPEDCGGVWGYYNLVDALQNPKHQDRAELLEWLGGTFDPEAFDPAATTKILQGG